MIPNPNDCPGISPIDFIRTTWHFLLFAIIGGLANYASRVKSGQTRGWSLHELAGDMLISGFVGTVALLLCRESGLSDYITGATVGMSGHLGSRALFIAERVIRSKLGANRD